MNKYCWVLQYDADQSNMGVFTTRKATIESARQYFNDSHLTIQRLNSRVYRLRTKAEDYKNSDGVVFLLERFEPNYLYH